MKTLSSYNSEGYEELFSLINNFIPCSLSFFRPESAFIWVMSVSNIEDNYALL